MSVKETVNSLIDLALDPKTKAPTDIQKHRIKICNGCEFRKGEKCSRCTCPIYDKVKFANQECPIKFWKKWKPSP